MDYRPWSMVYSPWSFPIWLTIICFIFFLSSCSNSSESGNQNISNSEKETEKNADSNSLPGEFLDQYKDRSRTESKVSPIKIDLKKANKIEILSLEKEMKMDSSIYTHECETWVLTAVQIEQIIRLFKSMSSELQYYSYSFYPCRIKGRIRIDNMEFDYYLDAGATLTLVHNNTELYFGCSGPECKKYFITGELPEGDHGP